MAASTKDTSLHTRRMCHGTAGLDRQSAHSLRCSGSEAVTVWLNMLASNSWDAAPTPSARPGVYVEHKNSQSTKFDADSNQQRNMIRSRNVQGSGQIRCRPSPSFYSVAFAWALDSSGERRAFSLVALVRSERASSQWPTSSVDRDG